MATQASFLMRNRNPDVLNSIANLSNDEVFTPPEFANRMLDAVAESWAGSNDGSNIWANSTLKFLDPFTKSGVFLREIVSRLTKGLESEIPDLQARVDHILTEQIYGVATTTLTSLVARRSVYCSKAANGKHSITQKFKDKTGNIWFERLNHEWAGGQREVLTADTAGQSVTKKLGGKCKFCGASQDEYERSEDLETHAYGFIHNNDPKAWITEIFGEEMQFDVIIGNPPFQLNDGGGSGTSAGPIYDKFVTQAKLLQPRFLCMVTPARWFSGGKGLDNFRAEMLADNSLRIIEDFPDSSEVFPGVQIKGGVCIFLLDRDNAGDVTVRTYQNGSVISSATRKLLEPGADVFIRYNEALPILRKVMSFENGEESEQLALFDKNKFSNLVSTRRPFGMGGINGLNQPTSANQIKVYQVGGATFVDRQKIPKEHQLMDSWKVFIPFLASGSDSFPHPILGRPFLGPPGTACTETYLTIGPFKNESESRKAMTYVSTSLFRFLVLLRKPSQNATRKVYEFVPLQDFSKTWTDVELAKKYGLSAKECAYISLMIRPMDLEND
jgi:site-specific DNA-methyltransferase (adenine-specific)